MAYLDSQFEFSDAQAVTTTAISTNVVDLASLRKGGTAVAGDLAANPRFTLGDGDGYGPRLVVGVNTAFSGGTSLAVTLEAADNAALSTNATVLLGSAVFPTASLVRGASLLDITLPIVDARRYLGLRFTVVGTFGAGNLDAFITFGPGPRLAPAYKSGFRVQ